MELRTFYTIYIRPAGSHTWTQHTKPNGIPWRSSNVDKANTEAVDIINFTKYCARVVPISLPKEPDDEDSRKYAVLADGDTLYIGTI